MIMVEARQIAEDFWDNGCVYLPKFFERSLMGRLDALVSDHFGQAPDWAHDKEFIEKSKAEIVPWFPQRDGVTDFDVIENNPDLKSLTTAILGDGWQTLYCMSMFSQRGTQGQAWHQDCPPESSDFNLNRLVYTADRQPKNGGQIVLVPGSHRFGELGKGLVQDDIEDQLTITPQCGDLILLHGHCWHRVLPVTGVHRISTNFRSAPKGVPEDVTDICVYGNMRYKFSTAEVVVKR